MRKIIIIFPLFLIAVGLIGGIIVQQNISIVSSANPQTLGAVLADQQIPTSIPTMTPTPMPLPPLPLISAQSYIIEAQDSDNPIIESNSHHRCPPDSTTKIMTALFALKSYDPSQIVTIKNPYSVGATIGLVEGEQISIEKLLYGLLLPSGNDAAMALADAYPQGQDQFIKQMNLLAHQLNLQDTQFANPSGLDHPDHYSTAQDLVTLSKIAMTHELFQQIVATKKAIVKSQDESITHVLVNRNELLGEMGVIGIKTGYTLTAGEVLVTNLVRKSGSYYIVVMGSEDRFTDSKLLIDWLDDYLGTYKLP